MVEKVYTLEFTKVHQVKVIANSNGEALEHFDYAKIVNIEEKGDVYVTLNDLNNRDDFQEFIKVDEYNFNYFDLVYEFIAKKGLVLL